MELYKRYNASTKEKMERRRHNSTMKIISVTSIAVILLASLLFSSCEKKELCYLDEHPHICHTSLTLRFNTAWDNTPIYSPYTRTIDNKTTSMTMRYILEFWTVNNEGRPQEQISRKTINGSILKEGDNSQVITIDLPATKIAILAWAEPLLSGKTSNPHFDTTNLTSVKMNKPLGMVEDKDAFTASAIWDYSGYATTHSHDSGINLTEEMLLLRPFGAYKAIANDMQEYYTANGASAPAPTTSTIKYTLWLANMYNVFTQQALGAETGAEYTFPVSVYTPDKEYLIAEDIIFMGTKDKEDNYYNFNVGVRAADNTLIHQSGNVEIRMQTNKHTLIYGAFLTNRKTNSPGIDDSFDEEIEWEIPDE